jgi:hypothetical protein
MRRILPADLLVAVGVALGLPVAEALYLSLAQEPVDASGQRVDWETIRARILVAKR